MNTISVSLGTLVDRTLNEMSGPLEQGRRVVLSSDLNDTDTTMTLLDATGVSVSDIIEFGSELVLVTAITDDATPTITISRGYYRSTAAAHTTGDTGLVNPPFPRVRVAEAVRRSFARFEALGLPLVSTDSYNREADMLYAILPAETRTVLRVSYFSPDTGLWLNLDRWTFHDDVPTAKVSTGKLLRVPRYVQDDDDLEVTIRTPYRWSTHPTAPTEASTITMIEGTEDLPAAYAAAWLVGAREISRAQIESSQEWNQAEPMRGGVSMTLLRLKWQDFYRSLDEARRLVPSMPIHRPYRRTPRL